MHLYKSVSLLDDTQLSYAPWNLYTAPLNMSPNSVDVRSRGVVEIPPRHGLIDRSAIFQVNLRQRRFHHGLPCLPPPFNVLWRVLIFRP